MSPRHTIADFLTCGSFLGVLTAHQESVEFWLRCGAYAVAIVSGVVALYFRFWPRVPREDRLAGRD